MTDAVVMILFVLSLAALGNFGYLNSARGLYSFDLTSTQIVVILSIVPAIIAAHRWSPARVGTVIGVLTVSLLFNVAEAEDKTTVVLLIVPALSVYYLAILSARRRRDVARLET